MLSANTQFMRQLKRAKRDLEQDEEGMEAEEYVDHRNNGSGGSNSGSGGMEEVGNSGIEKFEKNGGMKELEKNGGMKEFEKSGIGKFEHKKNSSGMDENTSEVKTELKNMSSNRTAAVVSVRTDSNPVPMGP